MSSRSFVYSLLSLLISETSLPGIIRAEEFIHNYKPLSFKSHFYRLSNMNDVWQN